MIVSSYLFHLRARNLSAHTIKAAKDYLTPFVACYDPLTATKRDIEQYLVQLSTRCKPSTVWTAWRHMKGLFNYLFAEGDIDVNPMSGVSKPIVPPVEVKVLTAQQVHQLLATCKGKLGTWKNGDAHIKHAVAKLVRLFGMSNLEKVVVNSVQPEALITQQKESSIYLSDKTSSLQKLE